MIRFGQDVCGNLEAALRREWLAGRGKIDPQPVFLSVSRR